MVWSFCSRTRWAVSAVSGGRTPSPTFKEVPPQCSVLFSGPNRKSLKNLEKADDGSDWIHEMKRRFLGFKKHTYMKELKYFQNLAQAQAPKVMVIACADSRVCPSTVLGFKPGEAFMVRNVANLVPPQRNGPSETNAALEFAVNTLQVENIFVIGHSNCGGIEALMRIQDGKHVSSCLEKWVINGKTAKSRALEAASSISFGQRCRYCEKESIDMSLMNMLTYPWIEDRVRRGLLFLHGGYYDLSNCTFERWRLLVSGTKYSVSDGESWS